MLHEGRSELLTVTGVDTIATHAGLRDHAATLDAAARACDAVARLFETGDPHPEVFALLANELALLERRCRPTPGRRTGSRSASSCCWRRGSCRSWPRAPCCGETEHLRGFSGAAGGVVCGSCEAAAFALDEERYGSWSARSAAAGAGARTASRAGAAPGRAGDLARPPSITRTCGCGRCCAA